MPQLDAGYSSKATGKPVSTFVQATTRFNKIGEALMAGFRFSNVPQYPGPFAAGLGVSYLWIGGTKNHDAKWLRLHLRRIVLKAKGHPRILHRAIEAPPSRDERKDRL
jgi:hypothetical protein